MEERKEIEIELKSEQMNEMLSHPPAWIARSGNGVFLLVIMSMIFLAWFIAYPDEVTGEVLVTTSKAPIELSNQSYIQLKTLHVRENEIVKAGDLIARFDIQAKAEDIQRAIDYLSQLEAFNDHFPSEIPELHSKLELGTFQEQWTTLLSEIKEWNSEHSENVVQQELTSIQHEIAFREQLQAISKKKISLSEDEYQLIEEQLASSERLADQHAISKQTLSQDKRTRTQAQQSVQNQKESHVQNLIALNSLRKERLRLEHDERLKNVQHLAEIQIAVATLRTGFRLWEKNSAWIAPCSGKVLFNKSLQVHRFYKANEASIVIVPEGSGYVALATIKTNGAGKVRHGQKVFIELVDFPKSEFGVLEGRVSSMTQIDKEGKYEIGVELPNQLKTTYGKNIQPKAQLKGTAKIITKDKRLLARFFEQFTDLIK
nr:HlyD family efflux transporter periplasmic adaptor subunit [uncultured Fluviicola sp.]